MPRTWHRSAPNKMHALVNGVVLEVWKGRWFPCSLVWMGKAFHPELPVYTICDPSVNGVRSALIAWAEEVTRVESAGHKGSCAGIESGEVGPAMRERRSLPRRLVPSFEGAGTTQDRRVDMVASAEVEPCSQSTLPAPAFPGGAE
jgi:hypothetical protein